MQATTKLEDAGSIKLNTSMSESEFYNSSINKTNKK